MTDLTLATTPQFPKGAYAALMGVTCVVAAVGAALVARIMGADTTTVALAGTCVGAASVATFLPVFFASSKSSGETNFGLLVLVASMARMLAMLGLALVFAETRELIRRPYWIGILAGGGLILIVESTLAVTFLSRLERLKSAAGSLNRGASIPTPLKG